MKKNIVLIGFLLVMCVLFAQDENQNENLGTTGFSFLKVNYSARAAAMANAFTGISDDAGAVFFNPAGIAQIKNRELTSTYMNYFVGLQCGSAVFVFPRSEVRTLAVFSQFLTATETRQLADENTGEYLGPDGEFGVSDIILGITDSREITEVLNLGVNVKYIRESIDGNAASAVALDIGILHQTTNDDLKLGVTVKNIGRQLTYYSEDKYKEKLPQTVVVGFGYHPDNRFYAAFDAYKPFAGDFSFRLGLEYAVHELLKLRAGYNSRAGDWKAGGDLENLAGISMGMGINWQRYNLDYAINSFGDLGFVNQVTLAVGF